MDGWYKRKWVAAERNSKTVDTTNLQKLLASI